VFCVGIHFIRWTMLRAIRRAAERGATESTGGNGVFHTEERGQR